MPNTTTTSTAPGRIFLALACALLCVLGGPALAQEAEEPEAEVPVEALGSEADIDEILESEDAVFAGEGYSYDPGTRRDPFKSLLAGREAAVPEGPRPDGIPGLLIDETDVTGIFVTSEGPVAQVQASDSKNSYLLRVGDQLYDGDVVSIDEGEVVFKQIVDDPTALKPFREVVKRLNP